MQTQTSQLEDRFTAARGTHAPLLDAGEVLSAHHRMRGVLRPTPLVWSEHCRAWLKLENLQVTGSFKVRGAFNAIALGALRGDRSPCIAASAGNHGKGVAWSARHFGVQACIVVPSAAPRTKVDGCRALGATVIRHGDCFEAAHEHALGLAQVRAWRFIHPFDEGAVIAGQGTVAIELAEAAPDTVLLPIGGGGLAAGAGLVLKRLGVRVVGVQVEGMQAMARALAGQPEATELCTTVADGLRVKRVGELTRRICAEVLDEIVTVTEEEVQRAIVRLAMADRIIAEGAGAAAVAALPKTRGKRKVAVVSGGNIDGRLLFELYARTPEALPGPGDCGQEGPSNGLVKEPMRAGGAHG